MRGPVEDKNCNTRSMNKRFLALFKEDLESVRHLLQYPLTPQFSIHFKYCKGKGLNKEILD